MLNGFPGLSYVAGTDAHQVGAAAVRATASVPAPVRIAPGQSGSASIRLGNAHTYPEDDCKPVAVNGLRVYPPRSTVSVVVGLSDGTDACSASRLAGGPELEVGPVKGR